MRNCASGSPIAASVLRLRAIVRLTFLSAMCAASFTGAASASPGARSTEETVVRVATWNIFSVSAPGSIAYNAAVGVIRRIDADMVGINEVSSSADIQNLMQLAADTGYDYVIVPSSNPLGSLRNAVMSRLPMVDSAIHTSASLSGSPTANDMTRLIVEASGESPDGVGVFTVLSQHWKAGTNNSDEFRRAIESIRIAQALERYDGENDFVIVMGDVNEQPFSVPQSPLFFTSAPSGLPQSFVIGPDIQNIMTTTGIYNDSFFHLETLDGPGLTTLPAVQVNGSPATRPISGRVIDHILVSQSLLDLGPLTEVYNSELDGPGVGLPKFGDPPPQDSNFLASDHLPVFVDFYFPGVPACPADLNGNGQVGSSDLAIMLGAWGGAGAAADLDGDGLVGSSDLAILLGSWGPCP
ncbi:MAG: hypothetical protein EA376_02495 [Phycisphaeraceae bacterium]|nr:MAG: hypothetical protein EA376_02495 [Phycisphaeraceae bacterium]